MYDQYKETHIPIQDAFPVGRTVEIVLGEPYDPFDFVEQTHIENENDRPEITILNPEVLSKVGQHKLELMLSYPNGRTVRAIANVTSSVSIKV